MLSNLHKNIDGIRLPKWGMVRKHKFLLLYAACFLVAVIVNLGLHLPGILDTNLLAPSGNSNNWLLQVYGKTQGGIEGNHGILKLTINAVDGTDWHIRCCQRGIDLKEGYFYSLKFRACSSTQREMPVQAYFDQPDYHNVGLNKTVQLDTKWHTFVQTFQAKNVLANDSCVPCFVIGGQTGVVWLSDVSLHEIKPASLE